MMYGNKKKKTKSGFVKDSKGGLLKNVKKLGKGNVVNRNIVKGKSLERSPFNLNKKKKR